MAKLPLVEGVLKYNDENNVRFSMPGHKGQGGFDTTKIGREFINKIADLDITEVEGVDNLHNAEGIIDTAQKYLAELYGSKKAYFLVNGSTSGNLTMICSAFNEGDKIIVERNCHKSIFNAVILRKLKPIYMRNKIDLQYNAPLSIDEEHLIELLDNNPDVKGIVLTYPNYYGICTDLNFIIREAKKRGIKVLVDSAHGAHFGVHSILPKSAVELGADMVVMSCHKTLPSFTQTAYLHINNYDDIEKVEFYLHMFLSSSPSYLLMCSMDYARYYIEEHGNEDYENLIKLARKYRKKINNLHGFHIIDKNDLKDLVFDMDETRYIINVGRGYSGDKLIKYLRDNKIQAEMNDGENVVLILGTFNKESDFKKLYDALKNCPRETLLDECYDILNYNIPKAKMLPFEIIEREKELVDIDMSCGRICGDGIVPYPPGIPIVTLGEVIDSNVISTLKYYLKCGVDIIGLIKDKDKILIKVVKNNL